ncbi:MAG: SIMPL domain-containing protein [Aeromonadaceae bacterium]|nr:SIMPL domain-containing protein [Aeromonadaceae bacterium]
MLKKSFLLLFVLSAPIAAQELGTPAAPHVLTNGSAEIRVPADMATLSFSITTQEKTPQKARQAVDTSVASFVNALELAGFKRQELVAGNLRLAPEYSQNSGLSLKLNGYQASRDVIVRVYQLDRVGQVIDVALKSGINAVQSIQYDVRDKARYLSQVREQAISDSKNKAADLAKAYGMTLGKIYSIQYVSQEPPSLMRGRMLMNAPSPADSYLAEDIRFSDNVSVVFNLD